MPGLFAVGCCGLLEEHMLSGCEGLQGPFVVQTDGQGIVDAIDGWVVDEV
jgi:hypothetical protein